MTDVGTQKEAADSKFRDMLKIFAGVASCKLILAGCAHDGGWVLPAESCFSFVYITDLLCVPRYASTIQSLETEGFDQIVCSFPFQHSPQRIAPTLVPCLALVLAFSY